MLALKRVGLVVGVVCALSFSSCSDPEQKGAPPPAPGVTRQGLGQPPVNALPMTAQSTNEDSLLVLSPSFGNGISVTDPDSLSLNVQFNVTNGTLTTGMTAMGVIVTGSGTASVLLNGSPTASPRRSTAPTSCPRPTSTARPRSR